MSYLAKFKGQFEYPDAEAVEKALKMIDDEDEDPDPSETNALGRDDFEVDTKKSTLTVDFSNFIRASSWYGCQRVLCKMSGDATGGAVKCSFEGDPDEWVRAGRGYT